MRAGTPESPGWMAAATVALAAGVMVAGCLGGPAPAQARLALATTTSVNDSGLLAFILPDFEVKNNAKVAVVAVGSGQALEIAKRGDADVVVAHSPAAEQAFMVEGSGVARWQIMYNYFAIVGPDADPAGVRDAGNESDAFARIMANGSVFVSRGDGSGTNAKELQIWTALGVNVSTLPTTWYKSTGQGMAATLNAAWQFNGYALTDEGTFWSQSGISPNATGGLYLEFGGRASPTAELKNTYSVIQLNATRTPSIHAALASSFATWLTSPETASLIASYSANGHPLFFPDPRRT